MTMEIIDTSRKQTAVYWALADSDSGGIAYDDYGQPQYTDPVELTVRWTNKVMEFITPDGAIQQSQATVTTGSDVSVGGVLMLGEITDITDENSPKENDGAWEIKRFDKVPTLDADQFYRKAYL